MIQIGNVESECSEGPDIKGLSGEPLILKLDRTFDEFTIHSPTGHHVSLQPDASAKDVLPVLERIIQLGIPLWRMEMKSFGEALLCKPEIYDTYEDKIYNTKGVFVKNIDGSIVKDIDADEAVLSKAEKLIRQINSNPSKWIYPLQFARNQ